MNINAEKILQVELATLSEHLARAEDWGEAQRQLNVALEERMGIKESRIAHLEDDLAETRSQLGTARALLEAKRGAINDLRLQVHSLMQDLANARRILTHGITDAQAAIQVHPEG